MMKVLAIGIVLLALAQDDRSKKSVAEAAALLEGTESAEVTFFRVDGSGENGAFHGYTITARIPLKDPRKVEDIRSLLVDPLNYGDSGAKCFEPGMGFRFKTADKQLDLVICLKCHWIYAYLGKDMKHSWAISKKGVAELQKMYDEQGMGTKK